MMRSLQSKLMLWNGLAIATLLIVAGLILYAAVRSALMTEFDSALEQTCQSLAPLIENKGHKIESELVEKELPQFARTDDPDFYEIFNSDGQSIERSSGLKNHSLHLLQNPLNKVKCKGAVLPDGRPGRIASLRFVPQYDAEEEEESELDIAPDTQVSLVVARDTIGLNRTLTRIRWLIGLVIAAAVLIGLAVSALVSRLALTSLRATTDKIASIDSSNLDTHIDAESAPTEIQSTIIALNEMLGRVKNAFQREQEFSGNVAHELRTPLAGLRSTIEVALTRQRQPAEYEQSFRKCLTVCEQTEVVIENLFTMARVDAGKCDLHIEPFELEPLIVKTWQSFSQLARERGLNLSRSFTEPLSLTTDREKLRLILRNVFDNAVTYADLDSTIELDCQNVSATTHVQIRNKASSLNHADIDKLFDRFWRAEESRSQTGQHSGLGLSLCRTLIILMGGTISAVMNEADELTVEIRIPNSIE